MKKRLLVFHMVFAFLANSLFAQLITIDRNKAERQQWFGDLAFGLQITWSIDVQLGAMVSDNLAVSSKAYQDFYFNELPKSFSPEKFDAGEWAELAKLAGVKYVLLNAKHHNGFCMWDTETSDFNIMNSGYGKDMLKELIDAFRLQGIAIGLSFSPDDYYVMYQQGYPPSRESDESTSTRNSTLWEINQKQLKELLGNYGRIDIISIEESSDWANPLVANYIWGIDPEVIVTRAGMETFEYALPEKPIEPPWEMRYSIGYHQQYVPEEKYKDASAVIDMLIATRASGGNFLLNIGPNAHGEIPIEQENRLREIALWMAGNHEAVFSTKACKITREQDVWFTSSKDDKFIYAFVNAPYWKWMEEKAFLFRSLRGSAKTKVTVLGQNDLMMEYQVYRSPRPVYSFTDEGIFVNVVKANRPTKTWDNPLVIRFEGATFRDE